MSSNRKTPAAGRPSRVAVLPVRERMRDLATDAMQPDSAAVRPDDPYLQDAAGTVAAQNRGTKRAMARAGRLAAAHDVAGDEEETADAAPAAPAKPPRPKVDPALLLNDLLEIEAIDEANAPYARYADGFTRTSRVAGSGAGDPNGALGRELRPSFVAFLIRRLHQNDEELAGHVVAAMLGELRASGEQERKWAGALSLRLCWNLTQREIARDLGIDQSTVARYLRAAEAWLVDYLERQDWVRAYLYHDAAPRYHIMTMETPCVQRQEQGEETA